MSKMLKRSCLAGMLVSLAVVIGCSGASTPSKEKAKAGGTTATSPDDEIPEPPQKSELPPLPQRPIVPRIETPRPEVPKPEVSKPELPKIETPKPAVLNLEEPKPEPPNSPAKPNVEEPKPEPPSSAEKPKTEEPKPAEKPKVEEPKPAEKPKAEEPKPADKPKAEEPKPADKPKAKEPKEEKKSPEPKREENKTSQSAPLKKAEMLVELPDNCPTPDGMALLSDSSVIVSMPNYNDRKSDPLLIKITKDNKVEDFFKLPPHPDTGRMGPMGIRAPSGDLYLADNQLFHHKDPKKLLYGKSRLMRITMKNGKPGEMTPVATGMNVANAVAFHDGYVYLTETILVPESKPLVSGVYRFKLDEKNVRMKEPLEKDPHLVLTMETKSPIGFGADGICFDGKGNLYVSDFADGVIRKIVLDKDGKVVSNELFAKVDFMKSCDGMDYDPRTDKIYSADLVGNAVHAISMDGKVQTLAQNADTDGTGGLLDAPCEALVRGNTIVVANMDFPVEGSVNKKFDKPYTISVIKLD